MASPSEILFKLMHLPGVSFHHAMAFMPDQRLVAPFRIISTSEMSMRFGEYETYPEPLAIVAMNNGF